MAITEHFLNGAMSHELLIGAGRGAQTGRERDISAHHFIVINYYFYRVLLLTRHIIHVLQLQSHLFYDATRHIRVTTYFQIYFYSGQLEFPFKN